MNLLWQAKEVLNKKGWTKHTLENYDGSVCSLGALYSVVVGNPKGTINSEHGWHMEDCPACDKSREIYNLVDALEKQIRKTAGELYPCEWTEQGKWASIVSFNDATYRTKDEVMHVFSHAAAEWDAERESGD